MKFDWRSLLVLSVFVAGLGLGACTNSRNGGGMDSGGMDSGSMDSGTTGGGMDSGTTGSGSGTSNNTGGTAPPTM